MVSETPLVGLQTVMGLMNPRVTGGPWRKVWDSEVALVPQQHNSTRGWGASGVGMERHSLFVLLQAGGAVGQQTKVLGDQQVQQAVVVGLGVQLEQGRVDVLLVAVGHLRAADLVQVAHEEALAFGHLVLVTLCQLVEVCELVQGRVGAGERGRRGQQERVQGDELPHVELAAPAVTGRSV